MASRLLDCAVLVLVSPVALIRRRWIESLLLVAIAIDVPFRLDVHLGFRDDVAELGALVGYNVSVTTIALVLLYLARLLGVLARSRSAPPLTLDGSRPLLAYVGLTAVVAAGANDLELALFAVVLLVQMAALHVYVASAAGRVEAARALVAALVVCLALQGLIALLLKSAGGLPELPGLAARIDPGLDRQGLGDRIGGTIGSPNSAGGYFALLLAPTFSLLLCDVRRGFKAAAGFAFALGAIGLVLTQSRGGWIAFAVSMAVLGGGQARRLLRPLPMAALGVTLAAGVSVLPVVVHRLWTPDGGAAFSRVPLIELAFRVIADHPIAGIGPNNFVLALSEYVTPSFAYAVHNKYLLVWSEAGLSALVAFIWFLASAVRQGWRFSRTAHPLAPLAGGLAAAVAGHAVHMQVEAFNGPGIIQCLLLVTGLIAALARPDGSGDVLTAWNPRRGRLPS